MCFPIGFNINQHTSVLINFLEEPFLGDLFMIQCIATLPLRYSTSSPISLILAHDFNDIYTEGSIVVHPIVSNQNNYTRNITFDPLTRADVVGIDYFCRLSIGGKNRESQRRSVTAKCKLFVTVYSCVWEIMVCVYV